MIISFFMSSFCAIIMTQRRKLNLEANSETGFFKSYFGIKCCNQSLSTRVSTGFTYRPAMTGADRYWNAVAASTAYAPRPHTASPLRLNSGAPSSYYVGMN